MLLSVVGFFTFLAACSPENSEKANIPDWPEQESVDTSIPNKRAMVIVFDGSGSMKGDKIKQAKTAVKTYVDALPKDVELGVVAFDANGIRTLSEISSDRQKATSQISNIKADGSTPLARAVAMSYEMLISWAKTQKGFCEYHLVVITDGEAQNKVLLKNHVDKIIKTPVRIFTIGFQIGTDHSLNQAGVRYVSADNTAELSKGLAQVLAEKE